MFDHFSQIGYQQWYEMVVEKLRFAEKCLWHLSTVNGYVYFLSSTSTLGMLLFVSRGIWVLISSQGDLIMIIADWSSVKMMVAFTLADKFIAL